MRVTYMNSLLSSIVAALLLAVSTQSLHAAENESVEFRLADWKTIHFDDSKKGTAHYDAVKKLGCEVKKEDHGGHLDVSYRCKDWKKMTVASHDAAHEWERWLKAAGFETKHKH